MMSTTITIHDKTKDRIVSYGKMTETYDDVINRLLDENENLNEETDNLSKSVEHYRKLVDEWSAQQRKNIRGKED